MRVSLDASALVPLFINDAFNERIEIYLISHAPDIIVSDFAAAEFASAIARRVRMGQLTRSEARDAFATFDMWPVTRIQTEPSDMVAAAAYMRRLDLNLRTPDALNIAIAQRLSATLVTFDDRMAHNARLLGVSVE